MFCRPEATKGDTLLGAWGSAASQHLRTQLPRNASGEEACMKHAKEDDSGKAVMDLERTAMKPGQFLFERILLRALVEDEGEPSPRHHANFRFKNKGKQASMSVLLTRGGSAIPGGIWLLLLKILFAVRFQRLVLFSWKPQTHHHHQSPHYTNSLFFLFQFHLFCPTKPLHHA